MFRRLLVLLIAMLFAADVCAQFAAGYSKRTDDDPAQGKPFRSKEEVAPAPVAPAPVAPAYVIPTPHKGAIRILANVNGDIITSGDINNRVRIFCMTSGIPYNEQTKTLIMNKVMQNTIDEKLKMQEASRSQIEISERELDEAMRSFKRNNGIPDDEFKRVLKQAGVDEKVFRAQIKADLAWMRVVSRKIGAETVTQGEIDEALALAKKDFTKSKYMVLEIVISKKDAKDIHELAENLKQDPRFELYASQFSQAVSGASGGRLGWVNEGQLPVVLEEAIKKLPEGGVSQPVLYNENYYIMKLEKRFDANNDDIIQPTSRDVQNMLSEQKKERMSSQMMQNMRQRASIEVRE